MHDHDNASRVPRLFYTKLLGDTTTGPADIASAIITLSTTLAGAQIKPNMCILDDNHNGSSCNVTDCIQTNVMNFKISVDDPANANN